MPNIFDCFDKCALEPIEPLKMGNLDVCRLLLSRTAVRHPEDVSLIKEAFDELISLENPLINRMLEIMTLAMYQKKMNIYITDYAEFQEVKPPEFVCKGFYYECDGEGIIVIPRPQKSSLEEPLSELLMHEMTHAMDSFLSGSSVDMSQIGDSFARPPVSPDFFSRLLHQDQFPFMKRGTRLKYVDKKRDLYTNMIGYSEKEQPKEFLPFFLQYFVAMALSNENKDPNPEVTHCRYGTDFLLFSLTMQALTDALLKPFKSAVDGYASRYVGTVFRALKVERLEHSDNYDSSFSEDIKIAKPLHKDLCGS